VPTAIIRIGQTSAQAIASGLIRRPTRPMRADAPLPTRAELLEYLRRSGDPLGKRELARAFQLKCEQRIRLKEMLAELKDEGLLDR